MMIKTSGQKAIHFKRNTIKDNTVILVCFIDI